MGVKTRRLAILGSIGIAIGVLPAAYALVRDEAGTADSVATILLFVGVAAAIAVVVVGATILLTSWAAGTSD